MGRIMRVWCVWRQAGQDQSVQRPTPPPDKQGVRALIDRVYVGGRLHVETAHLSLTVIFNWSSVV